MRLGSQHSTDGTRRLQRKKKIILSSIILLFILSSAIFAYTYLKTDPISLKYASSQSSKFVVVGDVRDVLKGDLIQSMYMNQSTPNVIMGLGAGAFKSVNRTGEMMIFDGKAYVKATDKATNYRMEVSNRLLTPFSVELLRGNNPSSVYVMNAEEKNPYTVDMLYQTLSQKHGRLFAVFGIGLFQEIDPSAIKLAPIYGDSLLDPANKDKYYHNLSPINGRVGIFFGFVNNPSKTAPVGYDESLEEKMFYVNPADRGNLALQSHTHILITTNETLQYGQDYSQNSILSIANSLAILTVNHLLTQSVLKKAVVIVYELAAALPPLAAFGLRAEILPNPLVFLIVLRADRQVFLRE